MSYFKSDIGSPQGFVSMFEAFDNEESRGHGIHSFYFNEETDIVRSAFVRYCMKRLGVLKIPEPLGTGGDWQPGRP